MIEAISSGGVVIFKGKILVLYKKYKNRYEGWVLPKGTVEPGEAPQDTAVREVREESGAQAEIRKYIGQTHYTFNTSKDVVSKTVHWYLMSAGSFYSRPQREEFFEDAGFCKYNEAFHLLRFPNERNILANGYDEYLIMRRQGIWK